MDARTSGVFALNLTDMPEGPMLRRTSGTFQETCFACCAGLKGGMGKLAVGGRTLPQDTASRAYGLQIVPQDPTEVDETVLNTCVSSMAERHSNISSNAESYDYTGCLEPALWAEILRRVPEIDRHVYPNTLIA